MSASGENGADETEPPSDDLLAAEWVLGVVDSSQRRNLQSRVDSERSFAERVAYWERRFAPWLHDIEAVEPPARVWTKICQRLGWAEAGSSSGLWGTLNFWRTVAALSLLVAIVSIGLLLQRPAQLQTQGQAVTALLHDDGSAAWVVSIDRTHGTVAVVPVPSPPDAQGRTPELWVIPAGKAPMWVASVSTNRSSTVTVPNDVRPGLVPGSVLAVSLEPPMPASRAAPTGPIVAKGSI
jgi:anti-sigma-K factor RskA